MQRLVVDVDKDKHKKLKKILIDEDRTVADFIRECIDKKIDKK